MKRLYFRVIAFIESEKYGPKIPLNNTLERSQACLGISIRSITNLKKEMRELNEQAEETNTKDSEEGEYFYSLRNRQVVDTLSSSATVVNMNSAILSDVASLTTTSSHRERHPPIRDTRSFVCVPEQIAPQKIGNVGRKPIVLSQLGEDIIRYVFRKMLEEKIYPTISTLLVRLLNENSDFPIRTESTLLKKIEGNWFSISTNSKGSSDS
ncbi:unnamed protein product [Rotaria sp. Silwood2]|nr:unnamed protein product [Rotaria sp. Silwood2]CAF4631650.1 unnamed protein product [Rotaria sp. Silwood2]